MPGNRQDNIMPGNRQDTITPGNRQDSKADKTEEGKRDGDCIAPWRTQSEDGREGH